MSDVGASPPLLLAATPPPLLADLLAGRECMITLRRPKIVLVFPVPAAIMQASVSHAPP